MPVTDHIRSKLAQVPHKPGVYLHKDRFGTVIYVGKARDLRRRVAQYFQSSRRNGWDLKFNALVDAIHDFDFHVVRSEPEALLLEGKLIKEFHPRYNISFRDDKRFLLLKVNLNDPIPRFTLTRLRVEDGARYFGPFTGSGALRRTLDLVRHKFNLRGCRPLTPTEADYKHCLYAHLKVCTAPCIGNVTREQYLMQVNAACDFLDGQCAEMAGQIEEQMKKAAATQDFERAAELRDLLADIRSATKKTREFVRVPYSLPVSINPEKDLEELAKVLGLPAPPRRIEGFDISNISGTFAVASLVSFKNGRPDRTNYRRFKMKTVTGQDDFACMAETIHRRYARLLKEARGERREAGEEGGEAIPQELQKLVDETSAKVRRGVTVKEPGVGSQESENEKAAVRGTESRILNPESFPDLILIDGGKGQLNAACAELKKLGLAHIPVIGLAKEFEEIYRPGVSEPLRLGLDHPAVKLLQRVRDESHRVANSYNAQLRLKRISESVLDEFPGIGGARKQALLKKFGSLHRLRLATVEQIAAVPGFGGKAAAELKAFLEARSVPTS
ncbi:MAG: excinuclease ABC subunit UvrC [Verrucomicrobia bacterium]|nr:excinuclease ABC subunit UvrC [Verrucomicrobiota bacterium]